MARAPDKLESYVPYLRRYARAITGSQALGDHYVAATLELIREDGTRLPDDRDARREMFRLFHEVWARAALRQGGANPRAWDFLGGVARRERQLLLLVAVEGCSLAEAAYILGIEEAQAHQLFRDAQAAAARHAAAPILVIEDDLLIAMHLESILEDAGYTVCGVAASEDEAFSLAAQTRPRLILADIHLKGGQSGVVAVRRILCSLHVPVIFITGYPQDLMTGMTPEPAFVITKPFRPETVIAAVSQALLSQQVEPDAAWRLRGRPPEDGDLARLQSATSLPRSKDLRHNGDDPRTGEGASCCRGAGAATHGSRDARREDTVRP